MFIDCYVSDGSCYLEVPEIDKYTHVAVVSVTELKARTDTSDKTADEDNIIEDDGEDLTELEITGQTGGE